MPHRQMLINYVPGEECRVAVVEDGLLHELGTHDELIENDGAYAALWQSWQS